MIVWMAFHVGTWVPLDRAVALARQLNVYNSLRNLFEYSPAPGEKPPTAPRSLESLNKRKSAESVKESGDGSASAKRRMGSGSGALANMHKQHRTGSLATILNSYGAENEPPSRAPAAQPASALSSPSPPLAAAACTNGNARREQLYRNDQTPVWNRGFGPPASASDIGFTTPTARHYTHNVYQTPETPESGRVLHHSSGGGRPLQRPSGTGTNGTNGTNGSVGNALRDISNTYQSSHYDDAGHLAGAKDTKRTPQMTRPGHSLMTPPSSATIRRPVTGYGVGGTAPRQQQPCDDGLLMLLRPPVPSSAANANSMAASQQTRRLSGVQSWGGSPVTPSRPSGSASSAEHSRTASTASGASEPAATPMNHARFVEYIRRARAPGSRLPADVERFVQGDVALEPNAIVPNARGLADGKRYLHVAAANAHWDVVRLLVGRGADPTKPDCDGRTALMAAACGPCAWQQRDARTFESLVDVLALSLTRRDKRGRTAVHWACMPPGADSAAGVWPAVSAYYVTCFVRKLGETGQTAVLAWRDYPGYSAEQLAQLNGLHAACAVLADAAGHGASQSAASSPESAQQQQQHMLAHDQYATAAGHAEQIIRSSTSAMRSKHRAESHAVESDIEYAAQLLLELSGERDSERMRAREHDAVVGECAAADHAEHSLKRKIEHVVGLQQTARASVALRHTPPQAPDGDADAQALLAEYAQLRRSIGSYENESQRLAGEYAELAAVVRPWARPPALSLLNMFSESAGIDADAGPAVRETAAIDAETAEIKAINAVLAAEQQRVHKLERVVSAACGDLTLDKVRTVVGPVLSVLNNGNAL
ncbi:hypothetical protein EV175_001309 [Coemansia sp. RSA 1933]|nr:hypothetical protein EV175_001309 [Coemansia sp. RSA 1933]